MDPNENPDVKKYQDAYQKYDDLKQKSASGDEKAKAEKVQAFQEVRDAERVLTNQNISVLDGRVTHDANGIILEDAPKVDPVQQLAHQTPPADVQTPTA